MKKMNKLASLALGLAVLFTTVPVLAATTDKSDAAKTPVKQEQKVKYDQAALKAAKDKMVQAVKAAADTYKAALKAAGTQLKTDLAKARADKSKDEAKAARATYQAAVKAARTAKQAATKTARDQYKADRAAAVVK